MTSATLADTGRCTIEIRKSRFLGTALPLPDPERAGALIVAAGDPEARHNCWAWRHGMRYRFHDADEPVGTAGKPILAAIDGQGLDQVLVVVTRWFGGIKLGAGGLVRAYAQTAAEALKAAPRMPLVQWTGRTFPVPWRWRDAVTRCAHSFAAEALCWQDCEAGLVLTLRLPQEQAAAFDLAVQNLSSGQLQPAASD